MDLRAELGNRIYKRKKKNSLLKWLFIAVLATCGVGILFYLKYDVAVLKELENTKQANTSKQLLKKNNDEVITIRAPAAKQIKSSKAPEKQTVFNDNNYQPRSSVNSMVPPPSRYYEKGEARSKAQVSEVFRSIAPPVETRTIPWQWKSAKNYRSGIFNYTQRNGKIETHTICRNYKYGSFEYRDCRKAAKQYFKDVCSSQFAAACVASGMIP